MTHSPQTPWNHKLWLEKKIYRTSIKHQESQSYGKFFNLERRHKTNNVDEHTKKTRIEFLRTVAVRKWIFYNLEHT